MHIWTRLPFLANFTEPRFIPPLPLMLKFLETLAYGLLLWPINERTHEKLTNLWSTAGGTLRYRPNHSIHFLHTLSNIETNNPSICMKNQIANPASCKSFLKNSFLWQGFGLLCSLYNSATYQATITSASLLSPPIWR